MRGAQSAPTLSNPSFPAHTSTIPSSNHAWHGAEPNSPPPTPARASSPHVSFYANTQQAGLVAQDLKASQARQCRKTDSSPTLPRRRHRLQHPDRACAPKTLSPPSSIACLSRPASNLPSATSTPWSCTPPSKGLEIGLVFVTARPSFFDLYRELTTCSRVHPPDSARKLLRMRTTPSSTQDSSDALRTTLAYCKTTSSVAIPIHHTACTLTWPRERLDGMGKNPLLDILPSAPTGRLRRTSAVMQAPDNARRDVSTAVASYASALTTMCYTQILPSHPQSRLPLARKTLNQLGALDSIQTTDQSQTPP
ncbi:hypothetical protein K438DRAFT_1802736, partial [Mycena galopus ATCC 62051]